MVAEVLQQDVVLVEVAFHAVRPGDALQRTAEDDAVEAAENSDDFVRMALYKPFHGVLLGKGECVGSTGPSYRRSDAVSIDRGPISPNSFVVPFFVTFVNFVVDVFPSCCLAVIPFWLRLRRARKSVVAVVLYRRTGLS